MGNPSIVFGFAELQWQSVIALVHRVDSEKCVVVKFSAVAQTAETILLKTAAAVEKDSLSFVGAFGPNVDDAVNRIGAPKRGTRAANDLDLLNVGEKSLLHVPEHSGEQGGVKASAVHQYLHLVRYAAVESASRNSPGMAVDLCHLHFRA